jgi:hypothetical protein
MCVIIHTGAPFLFWCHPISILMPTATDLLKRGEWWQWRRSSIGPGRRCGPCRPLPKQGLPEAHRPKIALGWSRRCPLLHLALLQGCKLLLHAGSKDTIRGSDLLSTVHEHKTLAIGD